MKNSPQGPIIYIEDDTDDRLIFQENLHSLSVTNDLLFFDNGKNFLDYIYVTSDQPLVIFCDINMPIMNGIELRKIILADPILRQKSIPFIFFTTSNNKREVLLAYDLTVQGYFIKPTGMTEMSTTLKMIYDYWCICKHPNTAEG